MRSYATFNIQKLKYFLKYESTHTTFEVDYFQKSSIELPIFTLIPPNSRILRLENFGNVSLEPKISSTKNGFQTRYPLNDKNSELENSTSLEPRVREGLVYLLLVLSYARVYKIA